MILVIIPFILITALLGAVIAVRQRRIAYLRDLCELRQHSTSYYRTALATKSRAYHDLLGKYRGMTKSVEQFLKQYMTLKSEVTRQHAECSEMRLINETLATECAKILDQNHTLEDHLALLQADTATIEQLQIEKFELRQQVIQLENANCALRDRNEDLEYAINLESISMLEAYQEQNKLFSAIDDVRRSLTRILNPA